MLLAKLGKSLAVNRNHVLNCLRARSFVNGSHADSPSNAYAFHLRGTNRAQLGKRPDRGT